MEEDWTEIVAYLEDNLGAKMLFYCGGLKTVRSLRLWRKGKMPKIETETRIRFTYSAAIFVIEAFGADTAKSWFLGKNQHLNDRAPAWVLRHGKKIDDLKLVVSAAKNFVTT